MPRHIREPTIHFFWLLLMDAASNTRTGSRPYYHIARYSLRMVVDSRLADRPRERETRQKNKHINELRSSTSKKKKREREIKKKKHFTRRTQQQTLLQ
eukprot:scaffold12295_cov85-Amphora_coffeaeformis.AAC.1